jgi:hypothetical protein
MLFKAPVYGTNPDIDEFRYVRLTRSFPVDGVKLDCALVITVEPLSLIWSCVVPLKETNLIESLPPLIVKTRF